MKRLLLMSSCLTFLLTEPVSSATRFRVIPPAPVPVVAPAQPVAPAPLPPAAPLPPVVPVPVVAPAPLPPAAPLPPVAPVPVVAPPPPVIPAIPLTDADRQKFEQEIAALKLLVEQLKAQLAQQNIAQANEVSEEIKNEINAFKHELFVDKKEYDQQKFKEMLSNINNLGEPANAIYFLREIDEMMAQAGNDLNIQRALEDITNTLATSTRTLVGGMYEKSLEEKQFQEREVIYALAKDYYDKYITIDAKNFNGSVLGYLIYIDRNKWSSLMPLWKSFSKFLVYASKDETLAILYKIGKVIGYNPKNINTLDAQNNPYTMFLVSLVNRVQDFDKGNVVIKALNANDPDVTLYNDTLRTLKNYMPIDYTKIQDDILRDQDFIDSINAIQPRLDELRKTSPILYLIQNIPLRNFKNFQRPEVDFIVNYIPNATVQELRALVYHMAKEGDLTNGNDNIIYLFKLLNESIKERTSRNQLGAQEAFIPAGLPMFENKFIKMKDGNVPPAQAPTNNTNIDRQFLALKHDAEVYQADYNIVATNQYIDDNKDKSPLLLLLKINPVNFSKIDNEKVFLSDPNSPLLKIDLTEYACLRELKGLYYHLLKDKNSFIDNEILRNLIAGLDQRIKDRMTAHQAEDSRIKTTRIRQGDLRSFRRALDNLQ